MQHVSAQSSIPELAHDAFVAYIGLLGRCRDGANDSDARDGNRFLLEATGDWRRSLRGLCGGEPELSGLRGGRSVVHGHLGRVCVSGVPDPVGGGGGSSVGVSAEPASSAVLDAECVDSRVPVEDTAGLRPCKRERKRAKRCERRRAQAASAGGVPEWRKTAAPLAFASGGAGVTGGDVVGHSRYVAGVVNATDDGKLAESVRRKWMAKNELEAVRLERELAVLKGTDVGDEVKRYRTKVVAATERNMVSIERTHGKLRETGNVSDGDDSRVNTILSDGSGSTSITPDSSASQADFRRVQKELLDLQKDHADLVRGIKECGMEPDLVPYYKKQVWTLDSNDNFSPEQEKVLDKLYPGGFARDGDIIDWPGGNNKVLVNGYLEDDDFY